MKTNNKLKKKYIIEFEFSEEELRILRCTFGLGNLPEVLIKSYGEFSEKELKEVFDEMRKELEN